MCLGVRRNPRDDFELGQLKALLVALDQGKALLLRYFLRIQFVEVGLGASPSLSSPLSNRASAAIGSVVTVSHSSPDSSSMRYITALGKHSSSARNEALLPPGWRGFGRLACSFEISNLLIYVSRTHRPWQTDDDESSRPVDCLVDRRSQICVRAQFFLVTEHWKNIFRNCPTAALPVLVPTRSSGTS